MRTIFIVLLAFAFLQTGAARAGEAENIAATKQLFDAFNRHDVDALITLYAPDAAYISPDVEKGSKGVELIRKIYGGLFQGVPNVHDTVSRIVAQGDSVAIEFVSRGSLPPGQDGKVRSFELPIASFLTFGADGKIVRDASYFDK
jgi:ketosteroid isomerase-like protein